MAPTHETSGLLHVQPENPVKLRRTVRVYVASAYTKGDVAINVRNNLGFAMELWELGYVPCAPLLSHFWHLVAPQPYEVWMDLDEYHLDACHALIWDKQRCPGESSGAEREVRYMQAKGKPVFFSRDTLLNTLPPTSILPALVL